MHFAGFGLLLMLRLGLDTGSDDQGEFSHSSPPWSTPNPPESGLFLNESKPQNLK